MRLARSLARSTQAEIELEQLQREESGSAMTARAQVRTVTQGWAVGVVLGWSAGLLVGCLFSPVLGFMIVSLILTKSWSNTSPNKKTRTTRERVPFSRWPQRPTEMRTQVVGSTNILMIASYLATAYEVVTSIQVYHLRGGANLATFAFLLAFYSYSSL